MDDEMIFFLIAGIIFIVAIIFPIYSVIQISSLKKRISLLEGEEQAVKPAHISEIHHKTIAAQPSQPEIHIPEEPHHLASKPHHSPPSEPGNLEAFIDWLKTDWLMKLGALFVLLAIVWFVRYAIINDWIGPMGRVAMGMIVSALILAAGFYNLKKRPVPAQVLMALGTTGILVTVFVARSYYDIFTPFSAMGIMIFIVVMIAVVAIIEDSLALGVISFLGGMIAPILTNSHDQNYLFLNGYLFALDCGIFAMVAMKGWRILLPLALVTTGFYSFATFNEGNLTQAGTQVFMALYYALFFIGIASAIIYTKKITLGDALTMAVIVLLGIYWVDQYVPVEWQSSVLSIGVVFAAITTALAVKMGAPDKIVYLSLAAAVGLLGAATAFELDGTALAIVLALEAGGVIALIRYVLGDLKATVASVALLIVPILLSLESFSWKYDATLFNEDFVVLLVVGSVIGFSSVILHSLNEHKDYQENEGIITSFFTFTTIVSAIFFIGLIWDSLETVIASADSAHAVALVIYTVAALGLFFAGLVQQIKKMKLAGIAILLGVILRLGFVEIWDMSLVQRTITFVVIGILLITTAFFQNKKHII
jgi:uncharacterized membrane protein